MRNLCKIIARRGVIAPLLLVPVFAGCGSSEPTVKTDGANVTASHTDDSISRETLPANDPDDSKPELTDRSSEKSTLPEVSPTAHPADDLGVLPKEEVSDVGTATRKALPEEPSAPSEGLFTVPGHFSVASPGNGYVWSEAAVKDVQGTAIRVLVCRKEGSASAVTLMVEHRSADDDGTRIAALKGHFNGLIQTLQRAHFTNLQGNRPSVESPVPERIEYVIAGTKPSGEPAFIMCATLFQRNVYAFQVIADTQQEAESLYRVVATLKER